jgi:hypothetical protein
MYDNPANDGVQFNVTFGGDPQAWSYPNGNSNVGLISLDIGVGYESETLVSGSYHMASAPGYFYDTWGTQNNATITNPTVYARYKDNRNTYNTSVTPGTYTYPGVASIDSMDFSSITCGFYGRPVWFESWFSENPTRTVPTTGFSGYTIYGDLFRYTPNFNNGNPVGYYRRFVCGVVKKDANLEFLTAADIMWGSIYTGNDVSGVAQIVLNGQIVGSHATTGKVTFLWADGDLAWTGNNFTENEYAQGHGGLGFSGTDANGAFGATGMFLDGWTPDPNVDTYNTKWGWYVDFVLDTPGDVGTFQATLDAIPAAMHTHPGWPVSAPSGGKLLVSTPLGPGWLPYCGLPMYNGQSTWEVDRDVENVELRPEDDFKDMVFSATGLIATTTTGALWANSTYFYDFLGQYWASFGATYGRGDTLMRLATSGYDRCYGWNEGMWGVWVTKTDGTLYYSGDYFWGCGLPDTPEFNTGAYGIHQVGTDTIWSGLVSIFGAGGFGKAFFNFSDGSVLTAGDNNNGALGNTYYTDDTVHVTYPIPFVSTPQAVELVSDNWHTGDYFRTATNEMYNISFDFNVGHIVYTLVDTGVTRFFGGSNNWFVCYEKTDGAVYRQEVGTGTIIQIHPGPVHNVSVDTWWGIITIVKPDGVVDMFEDEGIPLYTNIFPGHSMIKAVSKRQVVVGLTGIPNAAASYTNVPSLITGAAPSIVTITQSNGYNLDVGEVHTPYVSLLSTGEILANQGEIE